MPTTKPKAQPTRKKPVTPLGITSHLWLKAEQRLTELNAAGGKLPIYRVRCIVTNGLGAYVSGNPYLFSSEPNNAFAFREEDARAFIRDFLPGTGRMVEVYDRVEDMYHLSQSERITIITALEQWSESLGRNLSPGGRASLESRVAYFRKLLNVPKVSETTPQQST